MMDGRACLVRVREFELERRASLVGQVPDPVVAVPALRGQTEPAVQDGDLDPVPAERPDFDDRPEPQGAGPQQHAQFAALLAPAPLREKG